MASVHYAADGAELGAYPFEVLYTMGDGTKYLVQYTPIVHGDAAEAESTTTTISDRLSQTGSSVTAIAILAILAIAVGAGLVTTRKVRQ